MKSNLNSKNILFIFTIIFTYFASIKSAEAFTIYLEDFPSSDENKGAIGVDSTTEPIIDLTGVDWTVENISLNGAGEANLTDNRDWFKVTNGTFEGKNLDGPAIWKSPVIDISGYSDISFSLDFSESGNLENSGATALDYVNVEYDVDSTTSLIANQNGYSGEPYTLLGNFGSDADPVNQAGTIAQEGISGNQLQITVTMQNWALDERIRFDNVLVEAVPFEFSPSLGLFIAGGFGWISHLKKRQKPAQELPKR